MFVTINNTSRWNIYSWHSLTYPLSSNNSKNSNNEGAFGFSVFRFWSFLRSVFRFLHWKSLVFRFWYHRCGPPFRFLLIKKWFLVFCYSLVQFLGLVISPRSIHFLSRRPVTSSGAVVTLWATDKHHEKRRSVVMGPVNVFNMYTPDIKPTCIFSLLYQRFKNTNSWFGSSFSAVFWLWAIFFFGFDRNFSRFFGFW